MTTYITKSRDRLDRICFDEYGSTDRRVVEKVVEANPGLDLQGIQLPLGLTIELPVFATEKDQPQIGQQIFLWS